MPDNRFLDTNILIYAAVAEGEDWRAERARAIVAAGGTISVQVLNEFGSVAQRKFRKSWSEIRNVLDDLCLLLSAVRPISFGIHQSALYIAEHDGLSFYDALIVASALEAGCDILLTEDMQHGRVIAGRLTINNPFITPS